MGLYLPYVNPPKDKKDCPMNFGGICAIFVEGAQEKGVFPSCIGINCGRYVPGYERRGRWLTIKEYFEKFGERPRGFDSGVVCSECRKMSPIRGIRCPNCGIGMEND